MNRLKQVHMKLSNTHRTRSAFLFIGITCVLAVLLAISGNPASLAYGVTSIEKQAEADAITQRIDALQTELNSVTAQYEQALKDHEAATAAMESEQQRIEETETRIAELQVRLGNRAASMYKGGTISFIDVLLGASSFDEFLNTWDMVAKISSSDAALVQESKDLRQTALDAQAAFEAEQKKAALALEESKNTKEQMESTRAGMLTEIANINVEVAELQEEEALQAEAALRAKEDEERRQQSNNSNQSSITGTGQLGHPLPGATMTSGFGYRDFDQSFHQGIDFAAGTGTPYYAAESGTVSEAYPSGGGSGGIWLKIVHGNGLVTRYLHSSEIYVSVGDQVTKGQVIGAVGNTGNSSGAHLHFGVELNGSFVNPLSYL